MTLTVRDEETSQVQVKRARMFVDVVGEVCAQRISAPFRIDLP